MKLFSGIARPAITLWALLSLIACSPEPRQLSAVSALSASKDQAAHGPSRAPASINPADACLARALRELLENPYPETQARLSFAATKLSQAEAEKLQGSLEALHFIDYQHSAEDLVKVFLGDSAFRNIRISERYDDNLRVFGLKVGRQPSAFENYVSSRHYLNSVANRPLTLEQIQNTHRLAMTGGVDGLRAENLGRIRDHSVVGVVQRVPITAAEVKVINENPYLSFQRTRELVDGTYQGKIIYPTALEVKPAALERIRASEPELVRQIEAFQAQMRRQYITESPELNNRLISALINERLAWYIREKARIGPLTTPEKVDDYIRIVAEFQRDFISIHPFNDGNGRTSRLILNSLLEREGLPPPRLLNPNADIQSSLAAWTDDIREGMVATRRLHEDMAERIQLGLPLENSPELVTPYIPRAVAIDRKIQGSRKVEPQARLADTDARQFAAWLREKMETTPAVRAEWGNDPVSAARRYYKEFEAFAATKKVDFVHKTKGPMTVELALVDPDFVAAFGANWAADAAKWRRKMDLWHQDQLLYRGLARRDRALTEAEILRKFTEVDSHLASNRIASASGQRLTKLAQEEFTRYNRDLLGKGVTEMALDHSRTGPLYGTSYGYSTSTAQPVAEAFAMGAMVVGPYGKHRAPELQALLKDRIVVGMYRAKKDVELNTLRQLEPDFMSAYARQREVMAIGAADPDSVMLVQRIDANAKVVQSWVRNPEKPDTVWVLRGEFYPEAGKTPPPEMIIKSVKLDL